MVSQLFAHAHSYPRATELCDESIVPVRQHVADYRFKLRIRSPRAVGLMQAVLAKHVLNVVEARASECKPQLAFPIAGLRVQHVLAIAPDLLEHRPAPDAEAQTKRIVLGDRPD